ncbi:hypothetical protein SAMN06272735_5278 [Streptomyces sp. TLI_55]|uniref:spore-associated protein A n=1 Tax=Streptomyces sp. TLI_55 TaxID=1938861 RepID=UPI000BCB6E09|nr:spore-associated protein A [Streptomyces sp. TLI_55]SNX63469.1 hypothetical protein SAMN06272735_5278 [Streptomyces sp. TLI_55]
MRKRTVVSGFAVALATVGATLVTAPTASAAGYGCSGSLISTYPVKDNGGTTRGNVYLYYNSSNGYNCIATVKNSAGAYGTPTLTNATLDRCKAGTSGSNCYSEKKVWDEGLYEYYAGPVSLYADGHCISIFGEILGSWGTALVSRDGVHCG